MAKSNFGLEDIRTKNTTLTNFCISEKQISEFFSSLDVSRSRSQDGISPPFFQQTDRNINSALHLMFKNIKRLRKISKSLKLDCLTPIYKNVGQKVVDNYRPVSLLNIVSKVLEKCINSSLYKHVVKFLCKQQLGFVKRKSVWTNMLKLLQQIYEAIDKNTNTDIVAVYTVSVMTFSKIPHFELLRKVAHIGIGYCLLEILFDYLKDRKQFVRLDNVCSEVLEVAIGVPQGSFGSTAVLYFYRRFLFLLIIGSYCLWEILFGISRTTCMRLRNG